MTIRLDLLTAGWTVHPAGVARRGAGRDPVRFPALVGVVQHPAGVVLFDTGYAPRVQEAVSHGIDRAYGALLPVHVTPTETAAAQLGARGIKADDVAFVVLSHLHADHVGGLKDFPRARVVVPPGSVASARSRRGLGRLRRGLLPALVPSDVGAACCAGAGHDVAPAPDRLLDPASLPRARDADLAPLPTGRDLFGDGSLVVVPLPGHSAGHLGLLVRSTGRDVLLVGDAVWDLRTATHGELPHPVARVATADWRQYRGTAAAIGRLAARRPDLVIVPSHDETAIATARTALTQAQAQARQTHDGTLP